LWRGGHRPSTGRVGGQLIAVKKTFSKTDERVKDVRMLRVGLFNCLLLDHEIFALFDSFLATLIRKRTRRLSLLL
jgi:hypothetical protein